MKCYLEVLGKYAVFYGRAGRKEYWTFLWVNLIILLGLVVINLLWGAPGIVKIYCLAVLIPSAAVSARRLHDTGRSGWWLLIYLIPLIGAFVLLIFMSLQGKNRRNKFGKNPKLTIA